MIIQHGDIAKVTYRALDEKNWFEAKNALTILATNLMSVQNIPNVAKNAKDLETFTISGVFSLVMIFIVTIPILVLFVVLLGRVVTLWLCIALMPLTFLGLATKGTLTSSFFEGMELPDVFTMFLKSAFIPVFMAAPLSIGFLMLNAGLSAIESKKNLVNVNVEWSSMIAGVDSSQQILWHLLTAGVIWMGFFSVAKGQDITSGMVEKIKGGAESMGSWMAKAPFKYITFIPITTGKGAAAKEEKFSLGDLYKLPSIIGEKLDRSAMDRRRRLTGEDPSKLSAGDKNLLNDVNNDNFSFLKSKPNEDKAKALKTEIKELLRSGSKIEPSTFYTKMKEFNKLTGIDTGNMASKDKLVDQTRMMFQKDSSMESHVETFRDGGIADEVVGYAPSGGSGSWVPPTELKITAELKGKKIDIADQAAMKKAYPNITFSLDSDPNPGVITNTSDIQKSSADLTSDETAKIEKYLK